MMQFWCEKWQALSELESTCLCLLDHLCTCFPQRLSACFYNGVGIHSRDKYMGVAVAQYTILSDAFEANLSCCTSPLKRRPVIVNPCSLTEGLQSVEYYCTIWSEGGGGREEVK